MVECCDIFLVYEGVNRFILGVLTEVVQCTPKEVKDLLNGFEDQSQFFAEGVIVGGAHYMTLQVVGEEQVGRCSSSLFCTKVAFHWLGCRHWWLKRQQRGLS